MSEHLLSARQMARFAADGLLRFDALVPAELNRACLQELEEKRLAGVRYNNERLSCESFFAATPAYAAVIQLPAVQGIIRSLVGPEPGIDHAAVHAVHGPYAQFWHQDATIDPRTEAFDIQLFYYPHDTPRESGGTLFLPGSHFRRVHESTIARYQNIRGQLQVVCEAGTLLVGHHNIWHCGQPNHTDAVRYMVKLRLNPRYRQTRLFDAADIDHPDISGILHSGHAWQGSEVRLEYLQRIRFWRSLTGSDRDYELWLSRLENQPTRGLTTPSAAPSLARA
jgi:hypothetical protein